MKSHTTIMQELTVYIENDDIDGIIDYVKGCLLIPVLKERLKMAFTFLNTSPKFLEDSNTRVDNVGSFENIFIYSFKKKSDGLRTILIENHLIPESFFTRKDSNDCSPLAYAVINGDEVYVKKCLSNGADPNEFGGSHSLLELAAFNQHVGLIQLLIEYGADIRLYGSKSIFASFGFEDWENPNHSGYHHQEMVASKITQKTIVEILIKNGSNIFELDKPISKEDTYSRLRAISQVVSKDDDALMILNNEISNRKLLNRTIPLFFFGATKDQNCGFYGLPTEIVGKITSFTRYQKN